MMRQLISGPDVLALPLARTRANRCRVRQWATRTPRAVPALVKAPARKGLCWRSLQAHRIGKYLGLVVDQNADRRIPKGKIHRNAKSPQSSPWFWW